MQEGKFVRAPRVQVEKSTPEPIVDLTKDAVERKSQRGKRREQRSRADSVSRSLKRRGGNLDLPLTSQGNGFHFSRYVDNFPELQDGPKNIDTSQSYQPHAFSFLRQLFGSDPSQNEAIQSEIIAEVTRQSAGSSKRGKTSDNPESTGVITRAAQQQVGNGLVAGL